MTKEKRVLCVGMCVLDVIHVCEQYPTEDTDKRCLAGYWQRGGNASNNCTVLRQLGVDCEFLGMLSRSPAFQFLQQDCLARGICIDNCPSVTEQPPFSSVILVKQRDTRTIVHANNNFPILQYEHFAKLPLTAYSWIHFEARNPMETLRMLKRIQEYNVAQTELKQRISVSVEFEKVHSENLVLATEVQLVFLGKDLAQHMGWQNIQEAVLGLKQHLIEELGATALPDIVCTWGAQGAGCWQARTEEYTLQPAAQPVEIVDSLGAGDTFCAATIYALFKLQRNLPAAVEYGNQCASFKLAHSGYDDIAQFAAKQK